VRHQVIKENVAELGAKAGQQALDKAGLSISDIDVLITAGGSFDQIIPSQAALTLSIMPGGEDARCEAFHINTTCLSFVSAFALAADKLQLPGVKHVLVVASEVSSKGIGPENWETLTLFGDGAAAMVLEHTEDPNCGMVTHMHRHYTEGIHSAQIPGGGISKWFADHPFSSELYHFQMDGRELLRLTLKYLPGFMEDFFKKGGTTWPEVTWTIPHQASKTGLGIIPKLAQIAPEQVVNILEQSGNCISASIPMCLHELISNDKLQPGDTVMLCGTSAGYAIGSLLYQHG
jgi:3-oxoacyl-[acyl-carrier-protein] synthase-3